jgi:hypothetical protein
LKDVYDDAYAINNVINQLENNVSLREKTLYSDQIDVFYATFSEIVQQSKVKDVINASITFSSNIVAIFLLTQIELIVSIM